MQTRNRWLPVGSISRPLYERGVAALFCAMLAPVLGLLYMLARSGFSNPAGPVIAVVSISWLLTTMPFAIYAQLNQGEQGDWYRGEGFLTLVILALLAIFGLLVNSPLLLPVLQVLAGAGTLWTIVAVWRLSTTKGKLWFALAVVVYATWIAGVEWANGYLSPLFVENLVLHGGDKHIDTLFHISVANMIGTYGVPSIGMDGVPALTYHFGSHWVFAWMAKLTATTLTQFYQLGVPVILIPVFLRALLALAAEAREKARPVVVSSGYSSTWLVFLVLACATIGFLPSSALNSAGVWNVGPFLSESYVLAVAMSLLLLSTVAVFAKRRNPLEAAAYTNASSVVFLLVFLPVTIAAIGMIKVSLMLLLLPVGLFVIVRFRLYRSIVCLLSLIISAALALIVYRTVVWSGLNEGLTLFNFMRELIPVQWWPLFPILHLIWPWVFTYMRLKSERASTLGDVRALIAARKIIDVEIIVGVAILGLLPGMVFNLRGDAYYFSDVQRWFALALLLGNLALGTAFLAKHDLLPSFKWATVRTMRIERIVVTIVALCAVLTVAITVMDWTRSLVRSNLDTRREIQGISGVRPAASLAGSVKRAVLHPASGEARGVAEGQLDNLHDDRLFRSTLQKSKRYALVNALLVIGQRPQSERQKSLLYIDPALTTFWNFIPYEKTCQYAVMIGPALAATALLDGVPAGCKLNGFYGSEAYVEKPASTGVKLAPSDLCAAARKRGYGHVYRLSPYGIAGVKTEQVKCAEV